MPELDVLRRLGDQIVPPPFEALNESARRVRARQGCDEHFGRRVRGSHLRHLCLTLGHDTDHRDEPTPAAGSPRRGR